MVSYHGARYGVHWMDCRWLAVPCNAWLILPLILVVSNYWGRWASLNSDYSIYYIIQKNRWTIVYLIHCDYKQGRLKAPEFLRSEREIKLVNNAPFNFKLQTMTGVKTLISFRRNSGAPSVDRVGPKIASVHRAPAGVETERKTIGFLRFHQWNWNMACNITNLFSQYPLVIKHSYWKLP